MNEQIEVSGATMAPRIRQATKFVPLAYEERTHVDTECAAYHLGRRPQTMRVWASFENGPIRPIRVNRRLAWSVAEIRRLLAILP